MMIILNARAMLVSSMQLWFGRDIEANFLVKNLRPKFGPDSEDELNQLVI